MQKVDLLKQIPLFKGLEQSDLWKISEIATEESLAVGGQVFSEGSAGDSLYAIKYGTVRVLKGGDQEVARMGPGQHFGEMALVDDETRSATIDAVEHTELIRIKRDDLEKLLAKEAALGVRVYKAFARYLCLRLRQTTTDLTFMKEVAKRRGG